MRTAATETQEDKIRNNGNENVHSFPLGRTEMATETVALLDMSPSLADEQPIKEASHPEYRMWEQNNRTGVSTRLSDAQLQRWIVAVAVAGGS